MTRQQSRMVTLFVALALCATATAQAQWGNLKGQFIYNGKAPEPQKLNVAKEPMCVAHNPIDEALLVDPKGGIKNVVVYVRSKNVKVNAELEKEPAQIELDNKNCRFEPHVLPMLVSQTLSVKNDDPFSHNSNVTELGGAGTNPLLPAGGNATYKYAPVSGASASDLQHSPVDEGLRPAARQSVLRRLECGRHI